MCDLLTVMDSKIVQVALNGLENILRLGEQESKQNGSGINPYCALIEEAYGRHASPHTFCHLMHILFFIFFLFPGLEMLFIDNYIVMINISN